MVYQWKDFSCLLACHRLAQKNILLNRGTLPCSQDTNLTGREDSWEHQNDLLHVKPCFPNKPSETVPWGTGCFRIFWRCGKHHYRSMARSTEPGMTQPQSDSSSSQLCSIKQACYAFMASNLRLLTSSSNCKVRPCDSSCQAKSQSREASLEQCRPPLQTASLTTCITLD